MKILVTVLKNFNGSEEQAEIIERTQREAYPHYLRQYDFQRKAHYYVKRPNHRVSYKGKMYVTFTLPNLGSCISV
ncbi:hypothetical protein LCGC14_1568120 [marine sediment metagenome]|uniref:Uncharacterized protein n=1 Tax=marine sediment metagenome TaxID=412755 RepID=A0A0F9L1M1_9ZZZZ